MLGYKDSMYVFWFEQGSPMWQMHRACFVTASNFGTILGTNPYRSHADFCEDMMHAMTGVPKPEGAKEAKKNERAKRNMAWGKDHEGDGVNEYALRAGLRIASEPCDPKAMDEKSVYFPGLVVDDDAMLAASPDGLVGTDGSIEIKCPASRQFYRTIPRHYVLQCMGVMGICHRKWCDFVEWTPTGIRVTRLHFDEREWESMKRDLEVFYENHLDHYACCKAALADYLDREVPRDMFEDDSHKLMRQELCITAPPAPTPAETEPELAGAFSSRHNDPGFFKPRAVKAQH